MKFCLSLIFMLVLSVSYTYGQVCPCYDEEGNPTGATDCCPPGDPVPIQGLPILIGAGVIYGVMKLRKLKPKSE